MAKSTSPSPSREQNASNRAWRARERGCVKTVSSADFLAAPDRVAVERLPALVEAAHRLGLPLHQGAVGGGHVPDLADVLDAQVDRVHEAARGRQVRRRLHRRHRLGRVQRVDQHEAGPVRPRAPVGQLRQVGQVAQTPREARPHRVELRHEPPGAVLAQGGRQLEPCGRDHQRAGGLAALAEVVEPRVQPVPAERQVLRQGEGGLTDEHAVERAWLDPLVRLLERPAAAVLEVDPRLQAAAVRHVHGHLSLTALPCHDDVRKHPAPGPFLDLCQRRRDRVVAGGVDVQPPQHSDDGPTRHLHVLALPVPVLGLDAVRLGQFEELRRRLLPDRGGSRGERLEGAGRGPGRRLRRVARLVVALRDLGIDVVLAVLWRVLRNVLRCVWFGVGVGLGQVGRRLGRS